MQLYFTTTSPFVRKVLVTAHELGLEGRIDRVTLRPDPVSPSPELSAKNPLSKIPTLILDDGTALYDSRVICEYLDPDHRLVPESGPGRWRELRTQALADGVLDAGILVFYERAKRPESLHWPPWLEGQSAKVRQGLDALSREVLSFGPDVSLGQIAVAITLGWLEFRAVLPDLRVGRDALFRWYDAFAERPSMKATLPA